MKISKAIFGVNDSFYLEYWPKQAEMCKKILGWDPILFILGEEESDFYEDGHGIVKKIKQVDWIDSGLQTCLVRYWAPVLFPNDVCIFCDIDMFMLDRNYFIDQIKYIPDDELIIFTSDAYDPSREECRDLFVKNNLPFDLPMMYSTCYSASTGKSFQKIMGINGTYEDFLNQIQERYPNSGMNWLIDEFFFSDCVQNNNHGVNINRLRREVSTPFYVPKRIEKWGVPEVDYHISQWTIDREKYGPYDEFLLRSGYYIDFHAPRPYSLYKESIDYVCDVILNKEDTFQTMKEYPHSKVGIEFFESEGDVVDVGCLSWDWSKMFLGHRRVIGVDPFEESIRGAEIFKGVLGPFDGKTSLANEGLTSSVFSGRGEEFSMISWKSFCRMFNIQKVSILKINIEGGEYSLLNSMDSEDFSKIDQIAVSFHDWTNPSWEELTEASKKLLEIHGFYIQEIDKRWGWYLARRKKPKKVNPKKVALMSTFCDTDQKKKIFLENVRKVRSFGIDVIGIGPNSIPMPEELIRECDYFFYTKDNPLLQWPERMYTHWYELPVEGEKILTLQRGLHDYGWAALYQTKKLSQIALGFDYDIFYHMIYDVDIDEAVSDGLQGNDVNIVYSRRDPHNHEVLWDTTLHFIIFDRETLKKIEKEITLENYLRTNGVAEGEVLKWKNKYSLNTSKSPVKDLIFYWDGFDFFDYKVHEDFKVFLGKNPPWNVYADTNSETTKDLDSNLRIVFHSFRNNFSEIEDIVIKIDEDVYKISPKDGNIEEFPINSQEIKKLIFYYKNEIIDLTEDYKKIMINLIYYKDRK